MSTGLVRDSRCRRSISESNLPTLKNNLDDELPLNAAERRMEAIETLRVRKEALEEALDKKVHELRAICLREGELTGILPAEFPLKADEHAPTIRKRVKTEFTFSDRLLMKPKSKEEEKLSKLELDFEIQCKIVKASCKLCNEVNLKKSIRKQRKQMYQQALAKLKDLEKSLQATKQRIAEMRRAESIRGHNHCKQAETTTSQSSLFDSQNCGSSLSLDEFRQSDSASSSRQASVTDEQRINSHRQTNRPKTNLSNCISSVNSISASLSAPSTPIKNRSAKLMAAAVAANVAENNSALSVRSQSPNHSRSHLIQSPRMVRNQHVNAKHVDPFKRPNSALQSAANGCRPLASRCSESPEYDTISSNASSFGSQPNLKHCSFAHRANTFPSINQEPEHMNEYEQLTEHVHEPEVTKLFGGPTRRSAIALNNSQDDLNLIGNAMVESADGRAGLLGCQADHLIRHNSLENPRRKSYLNATQTSNDAIPCALNTEHRHASDGIANRFPRQTTSINMAQRPLPPPPVEAPNFHASSSSSSSSSHFNANQCNRSNHSNSNNQLPIMTLNHLSHVTRRKDRSQLPPPLNLNCPTTDRFGANKMQQHVIAPQLPPQPTSVNYQPSCAGNLPTNQPRSTAAGMCRLHSQQSVPAIASPSFDESTINSIADQILMGLNPTRRSHVLASATSGSSSSTLNCTNDTNSSGNGQSSPVPNLPPRTPVSLNNNAMHVQPQPQTQPHVHGSCSLVDKPPHALANGSSTGRFSSSQSIDLAGSVLNSISSSLNSMHSNSSSHSNLQQSVINLLTNNSGMLLNQFKHELMDKKQTVVSSSAGTRGKCWTETQIDADHSPVIVRNKLPSVSDAIKMHTETIERTISGASGEFVVPATPTTVTTSHAPNCHVSLSRTVSTNSVSNTQQKVLQPYWEEVKPYELSDFYKYSQKHRRKMLENAAKDMPVNQPAVEQTPNHIVHTAACSGKPTSSASADNLSNQVNSLSINNTKSPSADDSFETNTDSNFNYTLNEASFMIKTRVAEAFSDEMNAWYEEKYKTATLV